MVLAQQPLFRLIGAVLVLLFADMKPVYGLVAFGVWLAWVYMGLRYRGKSRSTVKSINYVQAG